MMQRIQFAGIAVLLVVAVAAPGGQALSGVVRIQRLDGKSTSGTEIDATVTRLAVQPMTSTER
jgi:hypothetical protein